MNSSDLSKKWGTVAVTLRDVALLANVSVKTVSNVVNGYPYVRTDTRARVQAAVEELDYRPNLNARALRSGRAGAVSLVIPDLRNAYFAELAVAVMESAEQHGLSVIIEQSGGVRDRELQLISGTRTKSVDGILFSPLGMSQTDSQRLRETSVPLVLLGESIQHPPVDHVTMQNSAGVYAATTRLVLEGRRRLVALGDHPGQQSGSAALRTAGFTRAIAEADIPLTDCAIVEADSWYRSGGADAMRRFLLTGQRFDGVVAYNDSLALGALHELQRASLRVPDDVSIIGFDDIDEARYSHPTLSTINPGVGDIASTAMTFLVQRMSDDDSSRAPRQHFSPFRLVLRDSTRSGLGAGPVSGAAHEVVLNP